MSKSPHKIMKKTNYLFDFKNITNPSSLEGCLKDWEVKKISDRTFKISGRAYTGIDLIRLYMYIRTGGHIFIYDYETRCELFYQKRPKGHKRVKAIDCDLDIQTLRCIKEFLANQKE
jgi:hypothetical protein